MAPSKGPRGAYQIHHEPLSHVCDRCHKRFTVTGAEAAKRRYLLKTKGVAFCPTPCMRTLQCSECRLPFEAHILYMKRIAKHYCSKACINKAYARKRKQQRAGEPPQPQIVLQAPSPDMISKAIALGRLSRICYTCQSYTAAAGHTCVAFKRKPR